MIIRCDFAPIALGVPVLARGLKSTDGGWNRELGISAQINLGIFGGEAGNF